MMPSTFADAIGQKIVESLRALLDVHTAVLYRLEPRTGDFVSVAVTGDGSGEFAPGVVISRGTGVVGLAMRERQPMATTDILHDPRIVIAADLAGRIARARLRSFLAAPLIVQDRVVGALGVAETRERVFDQREIRMVSALADQAAVAWENTRLYAEAERRRREAEQLAHVARSLTEAATLQEVGDRVVDSVRPLFAVRHAILRLLQRDGSLRAIAVGGEHGCYVEQGHVLAPGRGLASRVIEDGRPRWTSALQREPGIFHDGDHARRLQEAGFESALVVPLRVAGRTTGVLAIGDHGERSFSGRDAEVLQTFADQAAVAVENARLVEDLRSQRRRLEAVLGISAQLARLRPLSSVLDAISRACGELLGTPSVAFRIADSDDLVVSGARGDAGDVIFRTRIKIGESLAGHVAATGEAVIVSDLSTEPRLIAEHREAILSFGHRSWLGVPLKIGSKVLGVLSVRKPGTAAFSPNDLAIANAFASQAAVAIENARLFEDLEQRRHEAERLSELARGINSSLELAAILPSVTDLARQLCHADLAAIALRDESSGAMVARYRAGTRRPIEDLRIEPGKGLGGQVLLTGRPARTDDYSTDDRLSSDYEALVRAEGLMAMMVVPIPGDGPPAGLLHVGRRSARPFTDDDETRAMRLAAQAGLAIQNAQLLQRERNARAAVSHANRQLEALIEASPLAIIAVDSETRVTTWNRAAEEMFGWSAAEVLGRPLPTVPGSRQEEFQQLLVHYRTSLPVSTFETQRQRRCGTVIDVSISSAPLLLPDGCVGGSMALIADISARKELEAQLRQAQKMEAVGLLAGGIAHDFNNMLTVIAGRTEFLRRALGDAHERIRRDVQLIGDTAARAAALTQQLLAFGRKQLLQPQVLDLNELVGRTASMLGRLIGERIELVTILGHDLQRVSADPNQLEQVLLNLAVNARDAMPEGGRLTIATASAEVPADRRPPARLAPGRYVTIRVTDTGNGMTDDIVARIFEPFFTTKQVGKGSGLGLAVIHGIIQQHGGDIAVRSHPGRGSTFTVYLPAVGTAPGTSSDDANERGLPRGTETILVVEDDEEVRALTRDMLQSAGYLVLTAGHPDVALRLAEAEVSTPALLVTDVIMPQLTGAELADRLAARWPAMRVLYISGYAGETLGHHRPPRTPLLEKPFHQRDLLRAVRHVLDTPSASATVNAP